MKFGKKQPFLYYFQSKIGIVLLLLAVFLLGRSVYERYTIERDMASRLAEAEAKLETLQQQKSSLEGHVEYLRDDRGLEEEIRSNFDVARSGEQVVILTGTIPEPPPLPPPAPAPTPWWQFWR